jgi:hypothetical protein
MNRKQRIIRKVQCLSAMLLVFWLGTVVAQVDGDQAGDVSLVNVVPLSADEILTRRYIESIEYTIFVLQNIFDDVVIKGKTRAFQDEVREWAKRTPNMSVFQNEMKPWLDEQIFGLTTILNKLRHCEYVNAQTVNPGQDCTVSTAAYLESLEKACKEFNLACIDPEMEKEEDYLIDVWMDSQMDEHPELMLVDYEGRTTYFYSQYDANTVWDARSPPCDTDCDVDTEKAQQPMYLASRLLTLYYLYQRALQEHSTSNENESIMAYWLGTETCDLNSDALPKRDNLVLKIPPVSCKVRP